MNHPVYDTLSLAWQALSTATSVLISAHIDPDGDSIGSSLGLLHILRSQGIQAHIVQEHPIPKNLQFLPHDSAFIQHDDCLLYTSPSPRDRQKSRMPSSA